MKRFLSTGLLLLLSLLCICSLFACKQIDPGDPWVNATYRKDTEFGTGAKTVAVEVRVNDHAVTFTIHTDKEFLGDALQEHGLISGEMGQFGLYIKTVNGILADYDIDQHYWAFYQNGTYAMAGVDQTAIVGGEHFELVYEK